MNTTMHDFIQRLPRAELHVRLEGRLAPQHIFALAQRNDIAIEYATPAGVVAVNAAEHLDLAERHLDKLIGVGLDSGDKDDPSSEFAAVFAKARPDRVH